MRQKCRLATAWIQREWHRTLHCPPITGYLSDERTMEISVKLLVNHDNRKKRKANRIIHRENALPRISMRPSHNRKQKFHSFVVVARSSPSNTRHGQLESSEETFCKPAWKTKRKMLKSSLRTKERSQGDPVQSSSRPEIFNFLMLIPSCRSLILLVKGTRWEGGRQENNKAEGKVGQEDKAENPSKVVKVTQGRVDSQKFVFRDEKLTEHSTGLFLLKRSLKPDSCEDEQQRLNMQIPALRSHRRNKGPQTGPGNIVWGLNILQGWTELFCWQVKGHLLFPDYALLSESVFLFRRQKF